MEHYSEKQIKLLHQEFKTLKRYIDKLSFYDRHFGIIPFTFPSFDPALSLFFEEDKTEILTGIFKKERNNPVLTEKLFSFKNDYRFNIKPANSNSSIYSTYILSKFLTPTPDFDTLLNGPEETSLYNTPSPNDRLEKANEILNSIEYKLHHEYDKSLKLHCMTVFYKGFYDAFTRNIVRPDKKRKFIELYLYAQGILYAKYLDALRKKTSPPN
ncbi:MAG: hypothetical protein Q8939_01685 [Bacteroidota bacterium]|nr:hypothetical protein [Bacteroidota bacterium]